MRVFDWGRKKRTFSTVAFDHTGHFLAAGGGDQSTAVWDLMTGVDLTPFEPAVPHPSQLLQFHPVSGRLLVPTRSGLYEYDPATNAKRTSFVPGHYVGCLAIGPVGEWAVCSHITERYAGRLSELGRLDRETLDPNWTVGLGDVAEEAGNAESLACLGDGERFLSAEILGGPNLPMRRRVAIRSRADGRLLSSAQVLWYGDRVFGTHVLDTFVVLRATWMFVFELNALEARPREVRNDNRKHFTGLAFHPSGRFLAATSNDATVKLYDTTTWQVAKTFIWDVGRLRSVAFSPDGALAAVGSDAGKVVVWDVDG